MTKQLKNGYIYIVSPTKNNLEKLVQEITKSRYYDKIKIEEEIGQVHGGIEAMFPKIILCRPWIYAYIKLTSLISRQEILYTINVTVNNDSDVEEVTNNIREIRKNLGFKTKSLQRVHIADDYPEIQMVKVAKKLKGFELYRYIRKKWNFDCAKKGAEVPIIRK